VNRVLFDDFERSDCSPGTYTESRFVILNRAGGWYWARVRNLMEDWFSRLCPESQAHALQRIRSGDDRQFQAGFWEMYCHESLRRLGYDITCEPDIAGSPRHPDFLATDSAGNSVVLEATVASESNAETASERRKAEVFDVINQLSTSDFFLNLDVHSVGPTSPPAVRLRDQLEKWLAALDADSVQAAIESDGLTFGPSVPRHVWNEAGWHVVFRPLPVAPQFRGQSKHRPIGMHGPGSAYVLDNSSPLQKAIKDKAGAYGQLGLPYIVAVATDSTSPDDFDVTNALFGHEQFVWTPTASGVPDVRTTRAPDGIWFGPQGMQNRRVSALLITKLLRPWCVGSVVPTLWHHPAAKHPLQIDGVPWRTAAVDSSGGLVYTEPSLDMSTFFELPPEWPGPEEAFAA
jgi:hypothetical protein